MQPSAQHPPKSTAKATSYADKVKHKKSQAEGYAATTYTTQCSSEKATRNVVSEATTEQTERKPTVSQGSMRPSGGCASEEASLVVLGEGRLGNPAARELRPSPCSDRLNILSRPARKETSAQSPTLSQKLLERWRTRKELREGHTHHSRMC